MLSKIENQPPSNKSPLDYSVLIQTDSFQQQNYLKSNQHTRHLIKEVEAKRIFHNIFFLIIYRLALSTACHLSDAVLFFTTYNVYGRCASIGLQILFAFNIALGFTRQVQNPVPSNITKPITSSPNSESLTEKSPNLHKNNIENTINTQKSISLSSNTKVPSQIGNSSIVPSSVNSKNILPFDYSSDAFQKDSINSKFKKTIKPSSKFLYQMNSLSQT